ncbi:MAG TPA: VWA domain-containing protein [Pyrinomonadaceae bacterium]|jgi:VWFA-related protein|nr:VWA domain-containing protein [Pyrinomonadaceae bacterium]
MKKILLIVICLVFSASVLTAQSSNGTRPRRTDGTKAPAGSAQTEPPVEDGDNDVIKVDTTLVTIPVSVFDTGGRFISGLNKNDFRIFEDGQAQQIEVFATTEQPFTVVLLLDVSRSTQFQIEEIQDAAIAFVEQLRPQDQMMVVAFDDEIQILSEPTSDRRLLRNAIRRTRFGGGTKLYDAVDFALNYRLRNIEGRKAIVLFTDGVDSSSERSNYMRTVSDAERSDVIIYPVRYDTSEYNGGQRRSPWPNGGGNRRGGGGNRRGGGGINIPFPWPNGGGNGGGGNGGGIWRGSEDEYAVGERYLKELAGKTGGKYFNASTTGNLETSFAGIADELREQYSIGYYPQNQGQAGQRKQINVRVNRPNLSVKAKTSYVVGERQETGKFQPNKFSVDD